MGRRTGINDNTNPATKFIKWDGTNGGFRYWNKEEEKEYHVELPFTFMVLDTLHTIKGYDDHTKSMFWCNEVRDLNDLMIVRNKNGECTRGCYDEVINHRNTRGAKYCQSVYVATFEGDDLKIWNIQMMGAAVSSWIEFSKKNKLSKIAIRVSGSKDGSKGATKFKIPVFEALAVSEETNERALLLDDELQDYLQQYLLQGKKDKELSAGDDNPTTIPMPTEEPAYLGSDLDELNNDVFEF